MVKLSELKEGDVVGVIYEGTQREGVVTKIQRDQRLACINNGTQEFWYSLEDVVPLPLTEERLVNTLGFERQETGDGVKFLRGPFRVLIHDPGSYSDVEVWYREDRRHFNHPLYVHELQNHHLSMTKVPLEAAMAEQR